MSLRPKNLDPKLLRGVGHWVFILKFEARSIVLPEDVPSKASTHLAADASDVAALRSAPSRSSSPWGESSDSAAVAGARGSPADGGGGRGPNRLKCEATTPAVLA